MTRENKNMDYFYVLLVFLSVIAVYSISMNHGFIYDDIIVVVRQKAPTSFSDVFQYFKERHYLHFHIYRPVARASLLLQKAIHGNNPVPLLVLNGVLMGLCAALVYGILRLPGFKFPKLPAFFSAILFGLHPVASPCVYPVTGRETIISNFFIILAVFAFLHSGWRWYVTAAVACTLALFSKENALVLIGLFIFADLLKVTANPPGKSLLKWISRYLPILIIYSGYMTIRYKLFQGVEYSFICFIQAPMLTFSNPVYTLQSIIAPRWGFMYEPMTIQTWFSTPRTIFTAIIVFILTIAVIKRWRYVKTTVLFWLGWLIITNFPTSNVVCQEVKFAERYLFCAIIPVAVIAIAVTLHLWQKLKTRRLMVILFSIITVLLTSITIYRARYYKDNYAFCEQWVKTSPNYFLPYNSLADTIYKMGRLEESARLYNRVIRMNPSWPHAYLNLGIIYLQWGKVDEAESLISQYVKLNPNSAKAHYSLGVVLQRQGIFYEVLADSLKLQRKSNEALDYYTKAELKYNEALEQYSRSLSIDSENAEAHHNIGVIYEERAEHDKAIFHFLEALKINPDKANTLQGLKKAYSSK